MIIGRAEFIDDLQKIEKRHLERTLPLKGEESEMLGRSRTVVNEMINHMQFAVAQRDQ